jgi:hypothetical protein
MAPSQWVMILHEPARGAHSACGLPHRRSVFKLKRDRRVPPVEMAAGLASAPQLCSAISASIGMLKARAKRSSVVTLPCFLCVSICAIRSRATAERDASST